MDWRRIPRWARNTAPLCSGLLLAVVVGSCDRVATGPINPDPRPIQFETRFPRALVAAGPAAAAQLIPFNRVRINFRRLSGESALDTTFATQPDVDSLAITLNIPLTLSVSVLGETMTLVVTCINVQGDVVYRGGPAVVSVRPGRAPSPVVIQLAYVGAGSVASTIQIVPNALSVLFGQPFSFTATVFDQNHTPIANAPIVWSVREPSLARLTSPLGGFGTALSAAGTAHIIAQVPDGPADTATLTIAPLADVTRVLQLVSGGAQSGVISTLLGAPVVVRVVNAAGNAVAGVPVIFSPSNGGSAGSPTATTDANGRAQTSWTLGPLVGAQTLSVSATGGTGAPLSVPATGLAVPPALATALRFASSLGNGVAGAALGPIVVRAVDDAGQVVTSFTNAITIGIGANPGGASLAGARTVNAVNGVATFDNLSLDKVASGYTLVASAAGLPSVTSNLFGIANAAASVLALVSGNNQSGLVGVLLGSPLMAKVTDPFDNPVPGVTVAWGVLAGGGLLGNATTQTNSSGITSNSWTLGLLSGLQRVTATVSGLTGSPLTYTATGTVLPPVATTLAMTAAFTSAVAGSALPSIVVKATDNAGTVVTSFVNNITIALDKNPGGATLGGTRTVRAANGVATFSDLTLDKVASGYTLIATASGLTDATSGTFSITNAAASILLIAGGNNQTGLVSALLGSPLAAKVTDPFDNPVPGVSVAWGVISGGGLLGNPSTQTNAGGIATNTWTLGLLPGAQRVTAAVSGLSGSPATFSATGLLGLEAVTKR